MHNSIESIMLNEDEIKEIVGRLGKQISADYSGREILLVVILKGSLVFAADLMREITVPVKIDFMQASSYGSQTVSSGILNIKHDLETDISGKDVIIVEDIIDSGNTLSKLKSVLEGRNPASVSICTLLSKPSRRQVDVRVDYCGVEIPDEFVVGYGLDYDEHYRHLPYIGILKPSVYTKP